MDAKEKQDEILDLMCKNEEKVSELYMIYASKFPEYSDYWSGLAKEELGHSGAIRTLKYSDQVMFKEGTFEKNLIQISLKYMEDKIVEANTRNMAIEDAFSVAVELETNMLEQKFFVVFEGDFSELVEVFQNLEKATQGHVDNIRNLWSNKD
jgi:hypothetical protein